MTQSAEHDISEENAHWIAPKPYASDVDATHPTNVIAIPLEEHPASPYGIQPSQVENNNLAPAQRTLTKVERYKLKEESRDRVPVQTVTSRSKMNPRRHVREEQRINNLNRVLSGTDRLVRVNAERIQQALDILTPSQEEVVTDIHEWQTPTMTSEEAVTTLSAWAHMGDTLRETIRDSKKGSTVIFEGTKHAK